MFERFTDRARTVIRVAQAESRQMGHNYIGTEHLLLGLVMESEGLAGRVLAGFGVTAQMVRSGLPAPGTEPFVGQSPFTPRVKKVLELGLREALQMGCNYVGTEHLLLSLVREGEGKGAAILHGMDVGNAAVRVRTVEMLSGQKPPVSTADLFVPLAQVAECCLCAALVANRGASMDRHQAWHTRNLHATGEPAGGVPSGEVG